MEQHKHKFGAAFFFKAENHHFGARLCFQEGKKILRIFEKFKKYQKQKGSNAKINQKRNK